MALTEPVFGSLVVPLLLNPLRLPPTPVFNKLNKKPLLLSIPPPSSLFVTLLLVLENANGWIVSKPSMQGLG